MTVCILSEEFVVVSYCSSTAFRSFIFKKLAWEQVHGTYQPLGHWYLKASFGACDSKGKYMTYYYQK